MSSYSSSNKSEQPESSMGAHGLCEWVSMQAVVVLLQRYIIAGAQLAFTWVPPKSALQLLQQQQQQNMERQI
jgi:hypothetical protein